MLRLVMLLAMVVPIVAMAQQPPAPNLPQLEAARDSALTAYAMAAARAAEAKAAALTEENAKLKAENEELRKKLPAEGEKK